jgi:hypothetical protein
LLYQCIYGEINGIERKYLRVGEIAMSNLNSNHIVKISDVAFESKAEILYVTIPFSKTDQLGNNGPSTFGLIEK